MIQIKFLFVFLSSVLFFSSCARPQVPISRVEFLLGTTSGVTLHGGADPRVLDVVFQRIREIEQRMSVTLANSEISEINRNAGVRPVSVSEETFRVIEMGKRFAAKSNGVFDISVGTLVTLWGIGTDRARIPTPEEITQALATVNYRFIELDPEKRTVFLTQKGTALDLGGIAKGWAADEAARILKEQNVQHAIIDFGGNIQLVGEHPAGRPWRIGIQNPETARGSYLGVVSGKNITVVTSGNYERFFLGPDGTKYHHILDTQTGYPIQNELDSVTVIGKESVSADALSTLLFALGTEEGLKMAASQGVEAIFVTADKEIFLTEGIRDSFELKNPVFRIVEFVSQ